MSNRGKKRVYFPDEKQQNTNAHCTKKCKNIIEITLPINSQLLSLDKEKRECILQHAIEIAEQAFLQAQEKGSLTIETLKKTVAQQETQMLQIEEQCKNERENGRKLALQESKRLSQSIVDEYAVKEQERLQILTRLLTRETEYRKQAEEKAFSVVCSREQNANQTILAQLQSLTHQINTLTRPGWGTSSDKGKFGERLMETWLNVWFENYGVEIKDVSSEAHQGDFLVVFPHPTGYNGTLSPLCLLLEIKYKSQIGTEDVIKFHRDLDDSTKADAGLFVSLKSKNIPGHKDLDYSTRQGKMVAYVGNNDLDHQGRDVRSCILLLRSMYYEKGCVENSMEKAFWSKIKMQAEFHYRQLCPHLQYLNKGISSLRQTLSCLETLNKDLNRGIEWMEQTFHIVRGAAPYKPC